MAQVTYSCQMYIGTRAENLHLIVQWIQAQARRRARCVEPVVEKIAVQICSGLCRTHKPHTHIILAALTAEKHAVARQGHVNTL